MSPPAPPHADDRRPCDDAGCDAAVGTPFGQTGRDGEQVAFGRAGPRETKTPIVWTTAWRTSAAACSPGGTRCVDAFDQQRGHLVDAVPDLAQRPAGQPDVSRV
jgi:hypothetical protein